MSDTFTLPRADDMHLHIRDGAVMASVLPESVRWSRRAIIMPNLKPQPVTTTQLAREYRERLMAALPAGAKFYPLMTLYLTDRTQPEEIRTAKQSGIVFAVKLYPAGATTNSDNGVTDIEKVYPTLRAMAEVGMPLLVHGEVTDPSVDLFDREAVFIERHLRKLVKEMPQLKVVMEHITTANAVEFVSSCGPNVAATITAHHLLHQRNDIFKGGLRPHYYCLPILKGEQHRQALVKAATSGNTKFFLGTDSAPHAVENKQAACCSAGCYTAPVAMELYAEAFASVGALDKLHDFACRHGALFYGLEELSKEDSGRIEFTKTEWTVPKSVSLGDSTAMPFRGGEQVLYRVKQL